PPWIDDDDAPAARTDAPEATAHVGGGHQAAVRDERVRAEDEEELGPVQIGYWNEREMAEHAQGDEHLRQLVSGARGVDVPRAQRARERQRVRHQAEVVRDGIAVIDRDRVAAVLAPRANQTFGCAIQRVVPRRLAPARTLAEERDAKAIGVVVEVGERRCLGADVPAAEQIVRIAADRPDLLTLDVDQDAAPGLAKRAGGDVDRSHSLAGSSDPAPIQNNHRLDSDGNRSLPGSS